MKLSKYKDNNIDIIKEKTGNAKDIIYKDIPLKEETITIVYSNSVSDSDKINDFILRRLDEEKNRIEDVYWYIKNYIPNNNGKEIETINDAIYYILNGFSLVLFDNKKTAIVFENKAKLNSDILRSINEKGTKGPSDAFTENYQTNTGLIRKRIKSPDLWISEHTVGKLSNVKVGIFYLNDRVDKELIKNIENKINEIDEDYVGDSNFLLESISKTSRSIMPTILTTERADYAADLLLEGRIVLVVENSNTVIILPAFIMDFFSVPDDYHQKPLNVFVNRIIRIFAFIIAVTAPAIYISLMAYNWEVLPTGLLISFSVQRDGVPFSSVLEILLMSSMFQILRESDIRFPANGGSSLSIVGAIVLGQAAVDAGIVSPITIIVVGIASVAGLAFSSIDIINSIRLWQFFLLILASLFGIVGLVFGILIILAKLSSVSSCGYSYLFPIEPFNKKHMKNFLAITKSYISNPFSLERKNVNEKNN